MEYQTSTPVTVGLGMDTFIPGTRLFQSPRHFFEINLHTSRHLRKGHWLNFPGFETPQGRQTIIGY
jgi:hypothetical protein